MRIFVAASPASRELSGRRVSTRSGDRQQRDVPYVLVGDVQENRGRRVVTDQRRNVDDALMPEQLHGAGEGLRIDFAFADRIASELDDDPLLFSQRARGPAELHRVY